MKIFKRFSRKQIIIAAVIFLFLVILVSRNGKTEDNFVLVERGDIKQELFESGSIEKGENIHLSFKEGGRVSQIIAKEGQKVDKDDVILVLEKKELELGLKEAQAGLVSAIAAMQRFVSGATPEELGLAGGAVQIAQTNLESAEKNFTKQEKVTNEMLNNAYQGTPAVLGDAYSTVKEIEVGVSSISRKYFSSVSTPETNSGNRSRDMIIWANQEIEKQKDLSFKKDVSFSEMKSSLEKTRDELTQIVKEMDNLIKLSESSFFRDRFSEADSSSLREYRRLANLKLSENLSFLGSVNSTQAQVDSLMNAAESSVSAAKSALNQAQKESLRVGADPQVTDVQLRQAAVDQARARVDLFKKRIEDASLKSPIQGTISKILVNEGEVVSPINPTVILVPEKDLQITLDIYESDVIKMSVGNEALISFVAFPGQEFKGEVVSINPVGQIKDGAVYYRTVLFLDDYPEEAMVGMTVDVVIKTNERKDVLMIPERAVFREQNQEYVTVIRRRKEEKRLVELGLRGQARMIEVLSGLEENEKVLIK